MASQPNISFAYYHVCLKCVIFTTIKCLHKSFEWHDLWRDLKIKAHYLGPLWLVVSWINKMFLYKKRPWKAEMNLLWKSNCFYLIIVQHLNLKSEFSNLWIGTYKGTLYPQVQVKSFEKTRFVTKHEQLLDCFQFHV